MTPLANTSIEDLITEFASRYQASVIVGVGPHDPSHPNVEACAGDPTRILAELAVLQALALDTMVEQRRKHGQIAQTVQLHPEPGNN